MAIIQTKHQGKLSAEPARFEQLRELSKREGLAGNEQLQEEYKNLEKGRTGETDFENFLIEFGEAHWQILKHVWLDCNGAFECDFLVFTQAGAYTFEIKNYSGKYEYKENQWFRYGQPNSHNPLSQIQKAKTNLETIFKKLPSHPNVTGVLVFVGEFNRIDLHEQIPGIKIVQRNELLDFFWEMKQEERNYLGYPPDIERVLEELALYETTNPFQQPPIPKEAFQQMKRGICCSQCGNFDLKRKAGYCICSCGIYEPKEHAILRTICEYGILYPEKNFRTSDLTNFFGGELSKSTIRKYLEKYFQKIGTSRYTEYVNKCVRVEDIRNVFGLIDHIFLKL